METCKVKIGNYEYYVNGATEQIKEITEILGLKVDSVSPSKISPKNGIIKVWKIGELADVINAAAGATANQ